MPGPAVNKAVDPKQRDADIEAKLRLFGIVNAFRNGKLPSNEQINKTLTSAVESELLSKPNPSLSEEGKVLVGDLRDVINHAKTLFLTKNSDELLQDFIYRTSEATKVENPTKEANAPVTKSQAEQDRERLLDGLRTLGTLILSNGQFRKLLNDVVVILRSIAGDAATKAASRVSPSQDELEQVDRPAPDDQWHDVPDAGQLKDQFRRQVDSRKPFGRNDIHEAAKSATQTAHPNNSSDPKDLADKTAEDTRHGAASGVDAKAGLEAGVSHLRQRADENIPESDKNAGRQYRDRTQRYFENKFPEQRRDQIIWRLKKMVVEIQGHEDYQQAIDALFTLVKEYTGHSQRLTQEGRHRTSKIFNDENVRTARIDLKTLLERFADYTSLDDFFDALNDIYADAERDSELKNWFKSLDGYLQRCLKEKGYILQPDSSHKWHRLEDQGRFLLRERYRDHTDRLLNEAKFFGEQFQHDSESVVFGNAIQKLFEDLGTDENGNPAFKKHLLKDVTDIILPQLFDSIRYVPLPRIEFSDHQMDAVVENLVIESDNMLANVFEFENHSYLRYGRKTATSKKQQSFMISASQIQADLRDVHYWVNKKEGFPSITDMGVADIFLGGDGFSFKLQLSNAQKKDRVHFFKVDKVDVSISKLNIKLKKSNHKMMFSLFKPLLLKVLRPVILKALEKQIKDSFAKLDAVAYAVYQESEKAKRQAKSDPQSIPNMYQRYAQALQHEVMRRREQAQKTARDKKVNVATTKEESMFKHITFPGGISTKAAEYKERSRKGDKWHNELFGLGSAEPSGTFKPSKEVTRKSPYRNRATVNDGQPRGVRASVDSGYQGPDNSGGFGNKAAQDSYGSNTHGRLGEYSLNNGQMSSARAF